ncbi:substrate-binding periplasmic protein [Roseateles amylovorans]|uniref:Transporter substrate-binding domain-containing protein n=1 Tax=Roseateles amylovorans TaxID=2978473 RepID=A0ABY6B0G4_9BURK|nr:transporter substrate-binding domain-containing protein [Roseateles amylovorans]UXH78884.1 transporter substrate-binding domain-containing protein [Roseateles amylovorans]
METSPGPSVPPKALGVASADAVTASVRDLGAPRAAGTAHSAAGKRGGSSGEAEAGRRFTLVALARSAVALTGVLATARYAGAIPLGMGPAPASAATSPVPDPMARGGASSTGAPAPAPASQIPAPRSVASSGDAVPSSGLLRLRTASQSGSPLKYSSGDPQRPGLCGEIVTALLRADPDLRLDGVEQRVPLRRVELMLGRREIDVFFCLLDAEHRSPLMRYLPVPLYRVRHVLAMRADDPRVPRNWDELRAFARTEPLLVQQGTKLAGTLREADVRHVESARTDRDAMEMLVRGRATAVYGQDLGLRQAQRGTELERLVRIGPTVFQEDVQYAVVSRGVSAPVVARLTERLRQLAVSGELARLAERYR